MSDYDDKVKALEQQLPGWLKSFGQEAGVALQGYIGAEMGQAATSGSWKSGASGNAFPSKETTWSNSRQLRVKSGRLLRSFKEGDPYSLTKIQASGNKLDVTVGSGLPYASIHEDGGFIKSKGRMPRWFWAKFYESRNPFYRVMALSVMKRGGVNIRARAYFRTALNKFQKEFVVKWLTGIFDKILKALT